MFDEIGKKIKTVASVACWVGIVFSVIYGIVLVAIDEDTVVAGFLVMIVGSLLSWVGSFITYGFGQLVENSDILVKNHFPTQFQTPSVEEDNVKPIKKAQWVPNYECLDISVSENCNYGVCMVCKKSECDLKQCSIKTEIGTRNLNICDECIVEFQKAAQKQD